jgi:16S rRNA (cytosine967-C5)-methyltransferase
MDFLKPSFGILKKYYQAPQSNLKLMLSKVLDREGTTSLKGVITRTVLGVIRSEKLLDVAIKHKSERDMNRLDMDVLILLRIGVYLLFYSDAHPDYAVVNELVNFSRDNTKGFINALLRGCLKERSKILKTIEEITDLQIKYSISDAIIQSLKILAPKNIEENLEYLNQEPLFHLRINTKDFPCNLVKDVLVKEKVTYAELPQLNSFEVRGSGSQLRQLLREKKYYYFQNTASQMVSIIAAQYSKTWILDACAAPGTKSVTLSLIKPTINIVAQDLSQQRIKLLKETCRDFNVTNIHCLAGDIHKPPLKKSFDLIILDAPCTSSGTLRKNPDLKLKINSEMIKENSNQQVKLLHSLITNFPGTTILYSVCSFIRDETEEVMEKTLSSESTLRPSSKINITDLSDLLDQYGFKYKKSKYGFYLLPDDTLNNDLFYLSLLRNKSKT